MQHAKTLIVIGNTARPSTESHPPTTMEHKVPSTPSKADNVSVVTPFTNFLKTHEKLHIAWCVCGIVGCLLLYGVLQVSPCTLKTSFAAMIHAGHATL
jgi:hypothetical protein